MIAIRKLARKIIRRLDKEVASLFFIDQWVILTSEGLDMQALTWAAFSPIIPPPDRYWADPFVVTRDNLHYVFIEEKIYATRLGHIACLVLDSSGKIHSNKVVLQRPYHLSYPFLFEYEGQLYMLPECAQTRSLDLYRCVQFPDQWEFVQSLMQDVYAVDATLHEQDGKWWLFVNIKVDEKSSSLNQLFLFYANSPLLQDWTPHPMNPIVDGFKTARPAGNIFSHQDGLFRPSQDNYIRYGYAINFNKITKLSETEYEEVLEKRFEPPKFNKIRATHTFSQSENLTVIDAIIRRRKTG